MYLDCNDCQKNQSATTRRGMGCGFLPLDPRRNIHVAHELDGIIQDNDDICAGWYIQLPGVEETVVAHAWWEKSQLREWCGGDPPAVLMESVTLFSGACGEVEGFVNRRAREAIPDGPG